MNTILGIAFLFHASFLRAEVVGSPESIATEPTLSAAVVGKIGCNDLLAKILKENNLGEIDLKSQKVKGTAESRVRVSPRNGLYLIAAAKENKSGPIKVIYPAMKSDGANLPAIHGSVLTQRIRSNASNDRFEIQMRAGGNTYLIKAKVGGTLPDGQPSCTVTSVRTEVAERDTEAEAEALKVQQMQDMNEEIEPIFKGVEKTLNAEECRQFEKKMVDHPANTSIARMCKFLDKTF